MSLIVTFQGQFKPYVNSNVKKTGPSKVSSVATNFKDILSTHVDNEQDGAHAHDKEREAVVGQYSKQKKVPKRRFYARDIMTEKIEILGPENTINDAMDLFHKLDIHHIPIVENDALMGVVSDRLILEALASLKGKETRLDQIMTKKIIIGQEHTSVADIARVMLDEKINCLPVTDRELNVKGLITSRDIMSLLVISSPLETYA